MFELVELKKYISLSNPFEHSRVTVKECALRGSLTPHSCEKLAFQDIWEWSNGQCKIIRNESETGLEFSQCRI